MRDNLNKRKHVEYLTSLFCNERESVDHLFFDCIVAKTLWEAVAVTFKFNSSENITELCALWCQKNKKLLLVWLVLLPCGGYGQCTMIYVF